MSTFFDILKYIVFAVGACTIVIGVPYFIIELRKFGVAKMLWPNSDRFM